MDSDENKDTDRASTAVVFSGCLVALVAFALVALAGSGWQLSIYGRLATEGFTAELVREALICHGTAAAVWIILYSPILALMIWIKPWKKRKASGKNEDGDEISPAE